MTFINLIAPIKKGNNSRLNFKSLKNISNKQFVNSPILIKKYGMFNDTDKDKVSNAFDCFPFNKKLQGGQYDQLTKNISQLSPEAQQEANQALQGKGAIRIYARERGGDYQKAMQYLSQFYNTPEGKRYGGRQVSQTAYSQMFEQAGRKNIMDVTPKQQVPEQPKVSTPTYGPVQQVVVGYDTQGKKVYGSVGSKPYTPPQYFPSGTGKGVSYYSSVSGTPTSKLINQQQTIFSESQQPTTYSKSQLQSQIGMPSKDVYSSPTISYFEAGYGSAKNLGGIFTGRKPFTLTSFRNVISPFKLTVKSKGELYSGKAKGYSPMGDYYYEPPTTTPPSKEGIITYEEGGKIKRTSAVTFRELESSKIDPIISSAQEEYNKEVIDIKNKLNNKEISFGEAQNQLGLISEKLNKDLNKKIEKVYKDNPELTNLHIRDSKVIKGVTNIAELGIFSNPLTSAIAGAESLQKEPIIIRDLESIKSGKTTIGAEMKQTPGFKTSLYFGGTLLGGASKLYQAGKAVELGRIESALEAKPIKLFSKITPKKGGKFIRESTFKQLGDDSIALSLAKEEGKFGSPLTTGQRTTQVYTTRYFSGKPFIVGVTEDISMTGKVIGKTKGGTIASLGKAQAETKAEFSLVTGKPQKGTVGSIGKFFRVGSEPGYKMNIKLFKEHEIRQSPLIGGVSKRQGDLIFSKSGRIKQVDIGTVKSEGLFKDFVNIKFPEEVKGITKIGTKKAEEGVKFLEPASIMKTPFSKTFPKEELKLIELPKKIKTDRPIIKSSLIKEEFVPLEITPETLPIGKPSILGTKLNVNSLLSGSVISGTSISSKSRLKENNKLSSNLIGSNLLSNIKTSLGTSEITKVKEIQGTTLLQSQAQPLSLKQKSIQITQPTLFPGETYISRPPIPPEVPFVVPPLGFKRKKPKPVFKKEQAYDAYYLVEGTKKPRYEKIEGGLTLKSALGAMARVVDNRISARGKVTKTKPITQKNVKGKIEKIKPLARDTGEDYWKSHQYKFRSYATKKKKALPTGTFIERQKFRLDSPQERQTIQSARKRFRL